MSNNNDGCKSPSVTLSKRSESSDHDFPRSSWLDFKNFYSCNKAEYKISKLDSIISKVKQRDSNIFGKVIKAMQTQDMERARSLSLRKTLRILVDSRNAIEPVLARTTGRVEINESAQPNIRKTDRQTEIKTPPEVNRGNSNTATVLINSKVKSCDIYRFNRKSNHLKKSSDRNGQNRKVDRKSDAHY